MSLGIQLYARCIPSGECLLCPHRGRAVVYGPFLSRRRGASLGINLFPGRKTCSYNCVYCFRGETEVKTLTPVGDDVGVDRELLTKALDKAYRDLSSSIEVKAVDFSGNGEPTLHIKFPELVEAVLVFAKSVDQGISVGVFTNGSTLSIPRVVEALQHVDYIEAKLDTVDSSKFKAINQPVEGLTIGRVVEGLKSLRKRFSGTLVVQIMLLSYTGIVNYLEEDAKAMAEAVRVVEPDKINIYTVYRTPRLREAKRVDEDTVKPYVRTLKSYGLYVDLYLR